MEHYIKVSTLDNEFEAQLLESILQEHEIPHLLQSYHDDAYGNLFQTQKGWGIILAPESSRQEILEILQDIRK